MNARAFLRRHPLSAYFVLAYAISWSGSLAVMAPAFLRGEAGAEHASPAQIALVLGIMLSGPCLAGLFMTWIVDGPSGLRELFSRMRRWRAGAFWYAAALLVFPLAILAVLLALTGLVSPGFAPGFFAPGLLAGLAAGFLEEIGWTGFAFPRMRLRYGVLTAGVFLGILHGTWHLAADYMGSVQTHGGYWLPHFLAMMIAAMSAMRILLVWIYRNTGSVLLAQLTHASSTGFLTVLVPPLALSSAQDTLFYVVYATVLWLVVAIVVRRYGKDLVHETG